MIALDTNVLVRVFVDDPGQPRQVKAARRKAAEAGQIHVLQVVQVESAWVYQRAFGLKKDEILRILDHLRNNSAFVLQRPQVFSEALELFRESKLDFADCVILTEAGLQGIQLYSLDTAFAHHQGAEVLSAD